jgi:iron complex outermembrane recepter protein
MQSHRAPGSRALIAVACALGAAPLMAQQQSVAAGSGESADGPVLEEVVVTARKREESLQDVPLAVTAVNAAKIEELRIQTPDDLAMFTPGFSFVSSFGRSGGERPTVRGQTNIQGAANASFFVDGVYVSGSSISTETANLERIEVIKGPQAALYGRATFAGAINYVTKRPTETLTGRVSVTAGQHGEQEYSGFLSGPLIDDTLLYYVAARRHRYDGEYDNLFDGNTAGSQSTDSATLKLLWTPSESFDATLLTTFAQDQDDGVLTLGLQGREFNNCQLRVISGTAANNFSGSVLPRSPGYFCGTVQGADQLTSNPNSTVNSRTDVFPDPGFQRDNLRVALTTKTRFGGGYELTTVTSYHEEDSQTQQDVSYAAYDAFVNTLGISQSGAFWGGTRDEREDFAQEVRIDSPTEARFRWRLGGYYFKGNNDRLRNKKYLPVNAPLQVNCVQLDGGRAECPQSVTEPLPQNDLENRAVFGDIEFDFTDRLTATAEVRYAVEQASQENLNRFAPFCNPALPTNTPGVTINGCLFEGEWKSTTPRVTLRYAHTPDATYYLNFAQGTKPGGFNGATQVQVGINTGVPVQAVYEEEESDAWELGAKFNLFDRRATLNVAAFHTKLTGQQLTSNVVGVLNGAASVQSFIANIGETEITGIELDGSFQITENWNAGFTFSYLKSEIIEFFDNNQVNLTSPNGQFVTARGTTAATGAFGPVVFCNNRPPAAQVAGRPFCDEAIAADLATYGDLAGKLSPRTPKLQASLVTSYGGAFDNGLKWRVGGNVSHEGSKFAQVDNFNETGARTLVGANFMLSGENWDVTLWGKNLFDDDTALDIFRFVDLRGITPTTYNSTAFGAITPRGFGLSLPRARQFGATASIRF